MLNSYSSLIEVLVALNGAFVFVGHSNSYSHALYKYIFSFENDSEVIRTDIPILRSFRSLTVWSFLFGIFSLFVTTQVGKLS
jgi:hypothetical protein